VEDRVVGADAGPAGLGRLDPNGEVGVNGPVARTSVVLGAPIDDVTISEAVEQIAAMVEVGRATGRVHQVATVNVDFLVNATHDPALLTILQRTDLAIPDGMPVVWGSRLIGAPLRERTAGADLVPALAARSAGAGFSMALWGSAEGVAERAAELLRTAHPDLTIVGQAAPRVGSDGTMAEDEVAALREMQADIVCVALGHPKQERWIARYGREVGAPVYIGIGGTLDFLTGVTRRAPMWMQRAGLEWLHRAMSEPRRLAGRYARDLVVFLPALARQAWRGRRREAGQLPMASGPSGSAGRLRLLGPAPLATPEPAVLTTLVPGGRLDVDVSALERVDNRTLAMLAGLERTARRAGSDVRVVGLGDAARRSLQRLGAEGFEVTD
jgi:N-acetylglucosaminyldiphosphoundecaprenol N-acetyl-beta-D-mannosaminyltransferase